MVGIVVGAVVLNDAAQIILPADGIHNDNKRPRLHQDAHHHLLTFTRTTYQWTLYLALTVDLLSLDVTLQNMGNDRSVYPNFTTKEQHSLLLLINLSIHEISLQAGMPSTT